MEPTFLVDQDHQHDQTVTSVGFNFEYDLDVSKLEKLISYLMKEKGTDLYRYKGILPVKGKKEKFVFQGVHMLFGGFFGAQWKEGEKRTGRFIFIGKNLDANFIREEFAACKATPLRFPVGSTVFVSMARGKTKGTVIKQWDDGNAYRVKTLKEGAEVWAPEDLDSYISASQ
jgi:hypothetical protein